MSVDRNTPITGTAAVIADAAIRVMVSQGLDALSVRNVATEAGVAPGTVQYQMVHGTTSSQKLLSGRCSARSRGPSRKRMRRIFTRSSTVA